MVIRNNGKKIKAFDVFALVSVGVFGGICSNSILNSPAKFVVGATPGQEFSVTFKKSQSTLESGAYSANAYTISSRLGQSNYKVFADIVVSYTTVLGNDVTRFKQDEGASITFYIDPLSPENDQDVSSFQNITSVAITYGTANGGFIIQSSEDGSEWVNTSVASGTTLVEIPSTANRYIKFISDGSSNTYFSSITINYQCE
ncbi:MAG TPA: hypothetical protein PKC96_05575 [Bacilli bacterium]|nr:hypothetical protein [Bacilli bacterium]